MHERSEERDAPRNGLLVVTVVQVVILPPISTQMLAFIREVTMKAKALQYAIK